VYDGVDCPECGARGVGGRDGCNTIFQEVVGREFSQVELFRVHRLTVDAYSLQHPGQYMKSNKSAAAHLVGMCWSLEGDGGPGVSRALSGWLDGTPQIPDLPRAPGGRRGSRTVVDVYLAETSEGHLAAVEDWAADVWAAWGPYHDVARRLLEAATDSVRGR